MCPPCQTRNRIGPDQSKTTFPDMGVYVCVWGRGGGGIAVLECICVCGWGGGGGDAVSECICVCEGGGGELRCVSVFVWVWMGGGGGIAVGDCIYVCVCGGGGGGLRCVIVFVCGGGGGVHRSTVKHVKATTRIRRPPTLADHRSQDQEMLFPVN